MRHSIIFWLNDCSDRDRWLLDVIRMLKTDRQFSKVIRDGIRLIVALRAHQTDVLFELFPWLEYDQRVGSIQPPRYNPLPPQEGDIMFKIDKMLDEAFDKVTEAYRR